MLPIDAPIPDFSVTADSIPLISPPYKSFKACVGQKLYFTDRSSGDVINWEWDFGDGSDVSNSQNPSHTYTDPGNYTILLNTTNECNCPGGIEYEIEIEDVVAPKIECVGTVCNGKITSYYAVWDDPYDMSVCGDYKWTVVNGTINGPDNDTIVEVEWGNPVTGVGYITLSVDGCPPDICTAPTTVKVPIIADSVILEGPDYSCLNNQATYSIPAQPGSKYTWALSGGGTFAENGGTIYPGPTLNKSEANVSEITVNWGNTPGTYTLGVRYYNSTLHCGGETTISVNLLDSFYVSGPTSVCASNDDVFFDVSPGIYQYKILDENKSAVFGPTANMTTSPIALKFPNPGTFYVEAQAMDHPDYHCNRFYYHKIIVQGPPPVPDTVSGEFEICPETYYTYGAEGAGADYIVKWKFTGANIDSTFGEKATVSWNPGAPLYQMELTHQSIDSPYCSSPPLILTVINKPNPVPVVTGPDTSCVNAVGYYETTKEADEYKWSIIPATAGSIINQFNKTVEVQWHNNAGSATVRLETKVCDVVKVGTKNVILIAEPVPTVSGVASYYCSGRKDTFIVNAPGATDYFWHFGDGSTASGGAGRSHVYNKAGDYTLIVDVTYANNICQGPYPAIFNVHVDPSPEVRLSAELDPEICPADTIIQGSRPIGQWLLASVYTGSILQYDIDWYKDGVWFSEPNSMYQPGPTAYGEYRIRLTDTTTGCLGWSNIIDIDTCVRDTGQGGTVLGYPKCNPHNHADGNDFSYTFKQQCGEVEFTPILAAGYFLAGWGFDDPDPAGYSAGNTHFYPRSGIYHVIMIAHKIDGNGDTCVAYLKKPVQVGHYNRMSFDLDCPLFHSNESNFENQQRLGSFSGPKCTYFYLYSFSRLSKPA